MEVNPATSPTIPVYQKLPGSGATALQPVRLHAGPDHLLQVTSNGFSEVYQRFFFQDIQAITYHHTVTGRIWNGVFIGLAALFLLVGIAAGDPAIIPLGLIALFWIVLLAINAALGPTCACYIKTAVQTRRLPSIGRVQRARKIVDRLRPAIATAQGHYLTEAVSRQLDPNAAYAAAPAAPAVPTVPIAGFGPAITRPESGPDDLPPVIDRPT